MSLSMQVSVITALVDHTDTAARTLFSLPQGAVPLFATVQTEVAFNDTGTDVLDLGIAGDEDYFAAGVSVAAAGGQMVAFSQSPVLASQTGVVAKYTGQNGDATQGRARVAVAYGTPFYPH